MSRFQKAPKELNPLLTGNETSNEETIAERIVKRRRGSRTETKCVKAKNPFEVSGQKAPKKSRPLEKKEPQLIQEELVTEESEEVNLQEEMDAVTALLAMFKHRKAPQKKLESAAGDLMIETVSLKNASRDSSSSGFASQRIKMGPYRSQLVTMIERDSLTGSERFFEDNALQRKKFRTKKTSDDIVLSSHHAEVACSFFIEKHSEKLNELESSITRYFTQWEFQLNNNNNVLLYGFGSKEQVLEQYQACHNKNENITWIHFHGNDDVPTLDSAYLMLLKNLFGSQCEFSNFDLIRKAELIRDYFKVIVTKSIFKIIIHDIDGSLFEIREARVALTLLSDIPNIHFLATSENVNFFSVWTLIEGDKMNWHAHEVTSFRNYKLPTTNKKKIEKVCQSLKLEKDEVKSVLMSFNTNRREMFYMLAKHIVESKRRGDTNWNSIDLNKFFNYCNKSLVCREQKNFHLYLEDYYRQGLFISNKTRSGEIRITIPMPLPDIRAILLDKKIFGYLND